MIAQISSPIRALVLLFTILASLYLFIPYSPSRSVFSFTNWRAKNATAPATSQDVPPAKIPDNAVPPLPIPPAQSPPEFAKNRISGDLVDDPDEGGPRVRQATMVYESENFNAIYERSIDTHIKHGEKWGVPTHILRHDIVEAGFFNKPAYVLGLIIEEMAKPYGKRAGWVVWFDADTIILNPAVPWTLFLPPSGSEFDDIHLLATQDQNGFNAGMAIFRVSEWSVQMLSETLALRQLLPEVHIEFFDQGALRWVMERPGYLQHVIYQPHDWWNTFGLNRPPYDTDAFMLHFAGADCCGQEDSKGTVMGRWLDILENNPQEYTVELEKTKLPKQVEDYWALLKKAKKTLKGADDAEHSPPELESAKNDLWYNFAMHADNATAVSIAIKTVEDVMAQGPNAENKAKQKGEAKKEDKTPKKEGDPKKDNKSAEKDAASGKKGDSPGKAEEMVAKKEAVEANKKAAQAEEEKAS